jgi:hypothetical protein
MSAMFIKAIGPSLFIFFMRFQDGVMKVNSPASELGFETN